MSNSQCFVFTVRYAEDDSRAIAVYSHSCPAFQAQVAQLPTPEQPKTVEHTLVGRYLVEDRAGLFELQTVKGRQEAAQWLRRTVAVVRRCWNVDTENGSETIVKALYSRHSSVPR